MTKQKKRRQQKPGCLATLINIPASIVRSLSNQKITLPIGKGITTSLLVVVIFLCIFCCCSAMVYNWTGNALRQVGR